MSFYPAGKATHPLCQPHQEPGCASLSSVGTSSGQEQHGVAQDHLPLSVLSKLPSQVPPSPELQRHLQVVLQLITDEHQNLLQDEKR